MSFHRFSKIKNYLKEASKMVLEILKRKKWRPTMARFIKNKSTKTELI